MFDATSPRDRIVQSLLKLAADHDWADISFSQIAEAAELTLAETRTHFESRSAILKAFSAAVDTEVLKRMASEGDEGDVPRDRLFDTLMTRFEILTPYKTALRRLTRNSWAEPALSLDLLPSVLNGQRWMLEASGINTGGTVGSARVLGTSAIYARVAKTWLDDDDAGMAKTMAALDSRLRRGEKAMGRIDDACSVLSGFGNVIFSRRTSKQKEDAEPENASAAPSSMEPV